MEIWREWLLAACDWRYIAALCTMFVLWAGGKEIYTVYQEGRHVVEEVLDSKPRDPIELDMAIASHTNNISYVYRIDQESARVLRL